MRRPHVLVLGVVVALGIAGCAGCARPVAGQATYRLGAAAGTGANAASPADSGSTAPKRTHRPKPRRTTPTRRPTAPAPHAQPKPRPTHPQPPPPTTTPAQTTDPGSPTLAEFSVCLSLFQLSRGPDGAFRALPRHASMPSRAEVAKAYSAAYRQMMAVLRTSGLPPDDVVLMQALAVASATQQM